MSEQHFMDPEQTNEKVQTEFIRYYIQYTDLDSGTVNYYSGVNGMKQSKWSVDFERAFLFNHLLRKHEIEELIESTAQIFKQYNTFELKKVTFTLKEVQTVDKIL